MIDLPTRSLKIGLAAAVLAYSGIVAGGAYLKGRADGRSALVERLQSGRITILKAGKEIDDEVLRADDDALCALLGGCGLPKPADGG